MLQAKFSTLRAPSVIFTKNMRRCSHSQETVGSKAVRNGDQHGACREVAEGPGTLRHCIESGIRMHKRQF